jgi:hypothetical protein
MMNAGPFKALPRRREDAKKGSEEKTDESRIKSEQTTILKA